MEIALLFPAFLSSLFTLKSRGLTMEMATRFKRQHSMLRLDEPLTEVQMRAIAPSIFANPPRASRPAGHHCIPTWDVLRQLHTYGFSPYMVGQSVSRDAAGREHTKHTVRLRYRSQVASDDVNEIVLVNSHHAASDYQLLPGVFRFAGRNAMVCGTPLSAVSVQPCGDVLEDVIDGACFVVDQFRLVDAQKKAMRDLWLAKSDQLNFAKAARALKYGDQDRPQTITEQQLLHIERAEDNTADLWTTFNRVHEHMFQRGIGRPHLDRRHATTPGVEVIGDGIHISRALWALAAALLELKRDPTSDCSNQYSSQR